MKTQIKNLINGSKNVIRDEKCEKYANAPKATSHIGYAGTNREVRAEMAAKVFAENGEKMNVIVNGESLELTRGSSTTGNTVWYSCEISEDQFKNICNYAVKDKPIFKGEGKFSFTMRGDCTCVANSFTRKTTGSKWEGRGFHEIGEEFVTIED